MNYFFDENFAPSIARAIRELHATGQLNDKVVSWAEIDFGGMKDVPWIDALMDTHLDWVVLTRDQMRLERHAVQESGFTWCIFAKGWATLNYWNQAWKLVKAWPELVTTSERSHGAVFTVLVNGKITRTKPESTDGRREGWANWDKGAYKGESLGSNGTDVTPQRVFSSRTGPRERSLEAGNRVIVRSDAAGCTRVPDGGEFGGVGSVADSAVRLGVGWLAVGPGRG